MKLGIRRLGLYLVNLIFALFTMQDKPIENEVEKESPGTQSSEETNGSESDSENYNTEKIKNSEGNDETSKLPSIEQIDLTPKKSNHNVSFSDDSATCDSF